MSTVAAEQPSGRLQAALAIALHLSSAHPGKVINVEPNLSEDADAGHGIQISPIQRALSAADVHVILVKHHAFSRSMLDHVPSAQVVDSCGLFALGA